MDKDLNRPSFSHWLFLHVIPAIFLFIVISLGILGLATLLRKGPETAPTEKVLPVVEVLTVAAKPYTITVESQGTVEARTQTTLIAEVSGRVQSISPALYAGGFFAKGDTLATIEDTDYQAALAAAKSRRAEANLAYQQELANAAQALEDWKAMENSGSPSDLVLRKPQLARAQAALEAAEASVNSAERDLARTVVTAPYDGRVHRKFIDVGQYANARQSQIASIYSVDTAEIRLGLSSSQAELLQLPESYRDGQADASKPKVTVKSRAGETNYSWEGYIDRSEGAVDPQSRLLYVVAQVPNPYGKDQNGDRPPLKVGSFVTAEIEGISIPNAYVIPRPALRENDTLYLIREDRTLEVRQVHPIQKTNELVVVSGELEDGERVCLTPLQYVVNGMSVLLSDDEPATETEAAPLEEPAA